MSRFKLGLIVNPYAGIGGALALKGSDGEDIRQRALASGAQKLAPKKAQLALTQLTELKDRLEVFTAGGEMGAQICRELNLDTHIIYQPASEQTEAKDTELAAMALLEHGIDLLMFAGGDGTARNICNVVQDRCPVLGIPAGVKIHSGVYAITPKSAGRVAAMLVRGELVSVDEAEVRDIDEELFRQGKVQAQYYGEMKVPAEMRYIQAVKAGGKESEELVLVDIAAHVIADMQDNPETTYIMGSGSTVAAIMEELGLENTLLGVDLVKDQQLVGRDVTASELLDAIDTEHAKLVITLIGGQGHILGRGNQQLSPTLIRRIGRHNIMLVASKSKIQGLNGRPLLVDSGDEQLDAELSGPIEVICGYKEKVLYPIANPDEQ